MDKSITATTIDNSFTWEARADELLALKSIYCGEGECEIISPSRLSFDNLASIVSSDSVPTDFESISLRVLVYLSVEHAQQTTHRLCLVVVFNIDCQYPQNTPTIAELSSEHLPKHVTDSIHERLSLFIKALQPGPCLFEALQWIKDNVLIFVTKDTHLLLPSVEVLDKESDKSDNLSNVASVPDKNEIPSEDLSGKQIPQESLRTTHVCIAKLDHIRNEQKYMKLLNSWAKELAIYGKVFHTGPRSIYIVITGTSSSSVGEILKRWRTRNVDVDSQGRPCKEKLLSVLCQCQLSGFVCSWSEHTGRSPGLVMVHCSKREMAAQLNNDPPLQELLLQYS